MKKSQIDRILEYLEKGYTLTAIQALKLFGCFRLSSRINDLKKEGYVIHSKMINRDGKKFAQYELDLIQGCDILKT